jgi:hypothetical protein
MTDEDSKKPLWERIASTVGVLLIPVVIAFVGSAYTQVVKEREVQGKFVELALEILREKPTEETKNLRKWAISVVDRYSGVSLSEATQEELQKAPLFSAKQQGDSGPEVLDFQRKLRALGYDVVVNGNFDSRTWLTDKSQATSR